MDGECGEEQVDQCRRSGVRFLPEVARYDIVVREMFKQDSCTVWFSKMNGCQSMTVTSLGSSAGV